MSYKTNLVDAGVVVAFLLMNIGNATAMNKQSYNFSSNQTFTSAKLSNGPKTCESENNRYNQIKDDFRGELPLIELIVLKLKARVACCENAMKLYSQPEKADSKTGTNISKETNESRSIPDLTIHKKAWDGLIAVLSYYNLIINLWSSTLKQFNKTVNAATNDSITVVAADKNASDQLSDYEGLAPTLDFEEQQTLEELLLHEADYVTELVEMTEKKQVSSGINAISFHKMFGIHSKCDAAEQGINWATDFITLEDNLSSIACFYRRLHDAGETVLRVLKKFCDLRMMTATERNQMLLENEDFRSIYSHSYSSRHFWTFDPETKI